MATLNVLTHNLSAMQGGLVKMKANGTVNNSAPTATGVTSSAAAVSKQQFSKITVQNVLSENNSNLLNISNNLNGNTIVRKIKDFGMFGTVNASTGSASNRSASSLTAGTNTLKRVASGETKDKPTNASASESKPSPVPSKKTKASKESKKESAKLTGNATKSTAKERVTDKVCIPRLKNVAADGTKVPGTPGRKGLPLPLAVARRNARERNRVKQVNNGFAALRERIPEEVAETFESQGASSRGAAKKLSKVETLRMAVEYIRSLERLLGFDFPLPGSDGGMNLLANASYDDESFTLIKDEFDALSPSMDDQFDDSLSNYDMDDYFSSNAMPQANNIDLNGTQNAPSSIPSHIDTLPNITTLNGLQYIRIPGTNTYQLLTPDIFVGNSNSPPNSSAEEEQFNGLMDANCLSPSGGGSSAADLHVSPPLITGTGTRSPAAIAVECASSSSLSRSPVPQSSSPLSSSSPHTNTTANTLQHAPAASALSPAANELLLRTCPAAIADAIDNLNASGRPQFMAPTLPHIDVLPQPSRLIKQEYIENNEFVSPSTTSLMYQSKLPAMREGDSQRHHLLHDHTTAHVAAVSPPLDQANVTAEAIGLQAFYEHEQNGNFYESVVAYKKELSDSLLETSSNCHSGNTPTLSDESMIDTIDWWEAHTPNSDGGSVIL